jgi:hypothetical protein
VIGAAKKGFQRLRDALGKLNAVEILQQARED